MQYKFSLMNQVEASAISAWRYEGPYAIYNTPPDDPDSLSEMLDRRSPYYTVRNTESQIIGFFNFGTSALVWDYGAPGIYIDRRTIPIGLGMRPDQTGKGLGLSFVKAGLEFARKCFRPDRFCLYVFTWNERAIRVYERTGFRHGRILIRSSERGTFEFLEMQRDGEIHTALPAQEISSK
ncbi:N-acetyltransferase [Reticulibacter mediterranei]|uniref:N-acetyltransferase n=1 Tax=Reticulibacter mediterranei TaxID=2778369 RepID=A0A8J3MZB2_9CHLR|nr:GNAT family N-acetyltransferase [Reticulibacter mediterranei]GHO92934.1 N-acetyltransferase [Reticulibacter mediterranei]